MPLTPEDRRAMETLRKAFGVGDVTLLSFQNKDKAHVPVLCLVVDEPTHGFVYVPYAILLTTPASSVPLWQSLTPVSHPTGARLAFFHEDLTAPPTT